jgi:hypothetical protein
MALKFAGPFRFLLAVLFLNALSACKDDPPAPPPDTTAPTTAAQPPGGTFREPASVTLRCTDQGGSGCAATHYTTDGSTPTQSSPRFSAPIEITATTTLKFFSVDGVGNAEAVTTETYTFADLTAPAVSASPAGGTYQAAQTVTLTCDDGTGSGCASIHYTTDGGTPTDSSPAYTTPLTVSANTTLQFFATDAAGNNSAVVTETYVIDSAAPTVAASPVGGTYNSAQSVTLTCDDGTGTGCASIHYTTDGSTPTASSPQYTAALSISANTPLKFMGIDNAGNASAVRTESYVIDSTPPTVAAAPTGGTYNSAQSVTLTCDDGAGSGCASIRYTTDGSTPTASSLQYTAALSISANTTLKFIGIDAAGNESSVHTETYVIDTAAPTVTASPAGGTYNIVQSVTLTCNDGTGSGCASIRYTTDGSIPTTSSPQYTAALSITANTTLRFMGIDNAGNQSTVATENYVIDTAAPTVTASPVGDRYNSAQTVTLTCNDGTGSGCASIRYTTDGSTPTTSSPQYTAALSITANTTLKFIGIDNAGNQSTVSTETYVIDTAAPTVTASPAGGTYNSAQTVTLTCDDGTGTGCASIRYTTDGSTPTASSPEYATPISISANTTLQFIGIDNVGNPSTVSTETYVIDTVAPTVTANPVGGIYNAPRNVTLTCNDGTGSGCASIRYTTDGSTPTASSPEYTSPISISVDTTLKFIGIDNAGNQSSVSTEAYVIDTSAPTVAATPVGGTYNSTQTVTLTCNDTSGSGCASIHYTTDGSTPTASSPQYTTPLSISTNTTLKFIGIDISGNQSGVHTEVYIIDTVAPTVAASPVGGTYNSTQTVTLTCDDGTGSGCASIRYTADGSTPTASSPQYTTALSITANTTLRFIGIDNAGNQSTVRTLTYVIDTVAPTVAASPVGGAYTSTQTVTLTCNDGAGSGCASIRYTTDGSTPTASSPQYTTPLSISANTALKFIGIDNASNQSAVRTEDYIIDSTPPTTTATPSSGTYSTAQLVALFCNDNGGSGCTNTYYTVDGSTPTQSSPTYTSPILIAVNTTLKFFSMDAVGNAESTGTQQYVISDASANTSAQIAAVRAAASGPINLPIDQATVTYIKPAVGTDLAGFFLQAEQAGPAVFVAVDASLLVVGDRISLVATEKASFTGLVLVTAISSLTINARGAPVEPLRADVSTVDLPAFLNEYDSELISISGTLLTTFAGAGTGHVSSSLSTIGTPSGTSLQLRVPIPLQDQLDLDRNCDVTAEAPLWRFNTTAQPSGWVPEDITILSCPAPKVLSAAAQSPTSVSVRFDRRIAPASVQANGSQFTFNNGLAASAATVQTREVVLTTNLQTGGQSYTVTVNTSVTDTRGTPVNGTANTATFSGYEAPAVLRITEVAPNINVSSTNRDIVELYVVQGGSVANFTIVHDTTILATLPSVTVATGDVIVVHLNPDAATNGDAPGSEMSSKSQYPNATYSSNYDNAWDFHGGTTGITFSNRVLRVKDGASNTQDGAGFAVTSGTPPGSYPGQLQALQAEGQWLPANCGGAPCTYSSTPTAVEVSAIWQGVSSTNRTITVRRVSVTDSNLASDWAVGASSLGVYPNP